MNIRSLPSLPLVTLLATALPALSAGCGGDSGGGGSTTPNAASCDYRPAAGIRPTLYCQEYIGDATVQAAYKDSCTSVPGAVWASAGCPRASAVGGCSTTSPGITVTTWFYSGGPYADAAAVMSSCKQDPKATYVAP